MLRIDAKCFTAYYSETDEQTEHPNAIIEHYLQAFVNYIQDDWAKWIPGAEFVINNALSAITLTSSFLANFSQNHHLRFKPPEPLATDLTAQQQIKLLDIENFTKKMKDLIEHLRVEMLIAQAMYEFSANKSHCPCSHYFIGDKVWLNAKNLNTACPAVKLNNHHVRSFKVKHIFEKNFLVIELKLSEFMKVHSVFHVTLLSYMATDPLPGQHQEPWESVIAENSEWAWYVIRIFNFKVNQCFNSLLLKYYVKWEGYFPIWKPFYLVNNCQQALDKYHAAYSAAEEPHVHPCIISAC